MVIAMALVPCKVCGTLNSDEAEICLSCEFPVQGRKRPAIYQWAALGLFALFVAPLLAIALNWLSQRQQASPTSAAPPILFPNPVANKKSS